MYLTGRMELAGAVPEVARSLDVEEDTHKQWKFENQKRFLFPLVGEVQQLHLGLRKNMHQQLAS